MNRDQIDWLAFQYVNGELEALEQAAFEQLLAADPDACDAVAEAVALRHALLAAQTESHVYAVVRRPLPRLLQWSALAAAACLIGILVTQAIYLAPYSGEYGRQVAPLSIVLAWSELRDAGSSSLALADEYDDSLALLLYPNAETDDAIEPPGWMLQLLAPDAVNAANEGVKEKS